MKSILYFLFLISFTVSAQQLDKALLWKISGNGIEKPSYLFGTVHSTCSADLASIEKILDETSQIYFELDITEQIPDSLIEASMFMKNGQKLSDMLTESDFKALTIFLEENISIPVYMAEYCKPEVINTLLGARMRECTDGGIGISVEEEIWKMAESKKVYGLETFSEQAALLEIIPYNVQLEGLMINAHDNLASAKEKARTMMDLYSSQDIEGIVNFLVQSNNKTYRNYINLWLWDRNKKWIPKIATAIQQAPTLIAIGAAHLAGEEGIITLLRKKGYKVEAVK